MATNKGKKPTAAKAAGAKKKPAPSKKATLVKKKPAPPKKKTPAKKKPAPPGKKPVPSKKKPAPAKRPAPAPKKPAPAPKKPVAAPKKPAPAPKKPAPPKKTPAPPAKKPAPTKGERGAAPKQPTPPAGAAPRAEEATPREAAPKRSQATKPPERPAVKVHRPKAKMGPDGILILEEDKILQKAYYAGQQIHSPMGGFLQLLGVRSRDDGSAIALLECSASSLRYLMELAKASKGERAHVKASQARGEDPDCPRHGTGVRLFRAGKDLVCPLCGIAYGRV